MKKHTNLICHLVMLFVVSTLIVMQYACSPSPAQTAKFVPKNPAEIVNQDRAKPEKAPAGLITVDTLVIPKDTAKERKQVMDQINVLIEQSGTDSLTQVQLKEIANSIPDVYKAYNVTRDAVNKIVKPKDENTTWWQWLAGIIPILIAALKAWDVVVRKARWLAENWSPLLKLNKWIGHSRTKTKPGCTDSDGKEIPKGINATIKNYLEIEGYVAEITYRKLKDQPDTKYQEDPNYLNR